jgi:SAM-dependent methyltransferase
MKQAGMGISESGASEWRPDRRILVNESPAGDVCEKQKLSPTGGEARILAALSMRRDFYEGIAHRRPVDARRHYNNLIQAYFRMLIPEGARVLEVGCGIGDLLAAVKPSHGVGIDFAPTMIQQAHRRHDDKPGLTFLEASAEEFVSRERFDYIILSDLVNDLEDVQGVLENLRKVAHPKTRIVINFFNDYWRPVLELAARHNLKSPTPKHQNWLTVPDMTNMLSLAGWEVVKTENKILIPVDAGILERLVNRWVSPLVKFANLSRFVVARPAPWTFPEQQNAEYSCSVIIPSRNEAGNIENAVRRTPDMGLGTEIIFIEGGSSDNTMAEIERVREAYPHRQIRVMQQGGRGKGNAVREAFAEARGDILFILDADLTVPPEELPKFYETARSGHADFVNGVRLVYPMEANAMRFFNMLGNLFFSAMFTWLLGQRIKDTLCGTKVLFREDYLKIAANRKYFGDFDPFGDFDLLFGAARLNMKIVDLPIRYKARTYGDTNIDRWRHGMILLRMVAFAARRLKFIR